MRKLKNCLLFSWYGFWRGVVLGVVYALIALTVSELAASAGLSIIQSVWMGIILSHSTLIVVTLNRCRRHQYGHQLKLAEQLTKVLLMK